MHSGLSGTKLTFEGACGRGAYERYGVAGGEGARPCLNSALEYIMSRSAGSVIGSSDTIS